MKMNASKIELELYPVIIVRTPALTLEENLENVGEKLKSYIKDASPDFYRLIKDLPAAELENLESKISFSYYKYFNRAKYRPTPFGPFAAVTLVPVVASEKRNEVEIGQAMYIHRFRDWDDKDKFLEENNSLSKVKSFHTNVTVYKAGACLRYITIVNAHFQIEQVDIFPELLLIIECCRDKCQKSVLYDEIALRFELTTGKITQLLKRLISIQLLFTDLAPNITGTDYFFRRGLPVHKDLKTTYVISERKTFSGNYNDPAIALLPELINHLNTHLPYAQNIHIERFKKAFINKFDRQSVPLAVALDPEIGVGYANLAVNAQNSEFDKVFRISRKDRQKQQFNNQYLIYALSKSSEKVVRMEDYCGSAETNGAQLPNSFSILYHKYKDNAVIDLAGGGSANTLIGRFTMCGEEYYRLGKEIAKIEQDANPLVYFFDVAYQAEKHVDNINRRRRLYASELPLLSWSEDTQPLNLDDLEISVINDTIILFSKKLKKRLVPIIPTAYNYYRSDLSIYRFLSDLQHQSIRTDFSFPLKTCFSDLDHYPRICYKNFILNPETWLIPKEIMNYAKKTNISAFTEKLSHWFRDKGIIKHFKTGSGDQTLTFDPNDRQDVMAFSRYCCQHHENMIYIAEALIDKRSGIVTEKGEAYAGQMLLSIYHQNQVYEGVEPPLKPNAKTKRRLPPINDWLYLEVFCHELRSNEILIKNLKAFFKVCKAYLKRWFFIRYTQDGNLLRIRFQLKDHRHSLFVLTEFTKCLEAQWDSGLVSDLQIKTYNRELERFGESIENVEDFFYQDSKFALNILQLKSNSYSIKYFAIRSMTTLIKIAFASQDDQLDFVSAMATEFAKEFNFKKADYKLFNSEYETQKTYLIPKSTDFNMPVKQIKLFYQIVQNYAVGKSRYLIVADLIHLHINRLFAENQRMHEAILYQFLQKEMKRSMHLLIMKEAGRA
ncbi:hypothetical protein FFJ24_012040 [Pedobacter sp. KBS0701]|uniref:lantibiotic dehydratase n=1 Tax=Pedobacter sp. KBS0701 TaxID=2578106 RepID=UPI0011A356A7|nr:lantibiotic dehydratase [Pedobacter sp. KBS0701]QDW25506.1 hypothetical protein FFJ24_012040 [Pedobacter sp. KBS0701]